MAGKMKYYCTNTHCQNEVGQIEAVGKFKQYGKEIRNQNCHDCDLKSMQKLDKTPHAISVKKIAGWQAGQTKSYSK